MFLVSRRCLRRGQYCELRPPRGDLHQVRNAQPAVVECERTVRRVCRILNAVAGEVNPCVVLQCIAYRVDGGVFSVESDRVSGKVPVDYICFSLDSGKAA